MIEVTPVFVAVTRDAGVSSGTPSLRLAPELITLALQPPLNLRRSAMTDRRLKLSRSLSLGPLPHSKCLQLEVFPGWPTNFVLVCWFQWFQANGGC